jgi:hypothetical protein
MTHIARPQPRDGAGLSYMIDFPPSTLPANIRAQPFVFFSINGASIVSLLPPCITLAAVLHFLPKLSRYALPPPANLPLTAVQATHATPHVGMDIRLDIHPAAFQRIIAAMMHRAGFAVPRNFFQKEPDLLTCVALRKAWELLELPPGGLASVHMRIQTILLTSQPITLTELRALWNTHNTSLPSDRLVVQLMAQSYVQSHVGKWYSDAQVKNIWLWYARYRELDTIFTRAERTSFEFRERTIELRREKNTQLRKEAAETKRLDLEMEMQARFAGQVTICAEELKKQEAMEAKTDAIGKGVVMLLTERSKKEREADSARRRTSTAAGNFKTMRRKSMLEGKRKMIVRGDTTRLKEALRSVDEERGERKKDEKKDPGHEDDVHDDEVWMT